MKLKPMADNVLLKQYEAAETTVSGISSRREYNIIREMGNMVGMVYIPTIRSD